MIALLTQIYPKFVNLTMPFRLILHTAAYWLLLDVRDQVPSWHPLRQSEFASIRLFLLKIAGRVIETASCIRVGVVLPGSRTLQPPGIPPATVRTMSGGARCPWNPCRQPPTRKQRSCS
jgi:hypothetical protein